MALIEVKIDEDLLGKARQFAEEQGTTLEGMLADHLVVLASRAGRRLTVREQIYVDEQQAGSDSKRRM